MDSPSKIQQCQVISFDGDMTLWDFDKVMRHSLSCTLNELKQKLPNAATAKLTIDDMINLREEVAKSLKSKVTSLKEIRLQALAGGAVSV